LRAGKRIPIPTFVYIFRRPDAVPGEAAGKLAIGIMLFYPIANTLQKIKVQACDSDGRFIVKMAA